MLIAQISDLHIVEKGHKTLGVAPMDEKLNHCIAHINQFQPAPDLVLVTGDVTNNFTLLEAEYAAQLLNQLQCPYYVIPGNHDKREHLLEVFGKKSCPDNLDGTINYVLEDHPVRLIGVDSTMPKTVGGHMCAQRLQWLDTQLAKEPHKPTIIFMHHPPIKTGVLETNFDGFVGADELGKIIVKYSNVERIICGHIHLPTHTKWNGTIVSTAPSMGMRLGLDLTMTKPSEFYLDAPGYQLHHLTEYGDLVTHTVYVNASEGPFSFG